MFGTTNEPRVPAGQALIDHLKLEDKLTALRQALETKQTEVATARTNAKTPDDRQVVRSRRPKPRPKSQDFHPGQCTVSYGQLQHDAAVIMEFVKRFHLAGFTLHVHVIGDGTLKVVLDALEAARAADGISTQLDGLAHVQLAQPSDVARIGKDHLFVAFG